MSLELLGKYGLQSQGCPLCVYIRTCCEVVVMQLVPKCEARYKPRQVRANESQIFGGDQVTEQRSKSHVEHTCVTLKPADVSTQSLSVYPVSGKTEGSRKLEEQPEVRIAR